MIFYNLSVIIDNEGGGIMIYRPLYVESIMKFSDTPFIKILTGVRRCGKSTILEMIMEKLLERGISNNQILAYRFDSMEYEDMTAKQMYLELKNRLNTDKKSYLFLDEVQEISGWEKVVNSLNTDFDVDIYITGSNSRMMSSEIATYLTGRYVSFRIFPLSFAEYLTFKKEYADISSIHEELTEYLEYGGFPAIHLGKTSTVEAYTIVRDIYNSTVFSDIVKRHNIRKIDQFERVVKFVFNNVGKTFSATSISKYLKSEKRSIDNETVYNYLEMLESAYLIYRCSRYDINGKELLKTQEKFYLADSTFQYAVLGYDPKNTASMLENIVYLELLRRGYTVNIGKLQEAEIDFIAVKGNDKIYIQVTKEINNIETENREYDRLLEIHDNYPKYVLRTDAFAKGNHQGIKTMHIADFLLSDGF